MENKQTAVQWLVDNILVKFEDHFNEHFIFDLSQPPKISYYNAFIDSTDLSEYVNKAIEMEKEEIKNAFVECWKNNVPEGIECKLSSEEYYNETYAKNS